MIEPTEPFNSPIILPLPKLQKSTSTAMLKTNSALSRDVKTYQNPTFPANLLEIYWISIVQNSQKLLITTQNRV